MSVHRVFARLSLAFLVLCMPVAAFAGNDEPAPPSPGPPAKCAAFYVDIPSAGNPLANMMLGSMVGSAAWMDQLKMTLSLGKEPPVTRLVVAGQSESVVRKAVQAALDSFKGERLPYMSLTVAGSSPKLQARAEQLGITFHAVPVDPSAASSSARATTYLRGVCDQTVPADGG